MIRHATMEDSSVICALLSQLGYQVTLASVEAMLNDNRQPTLVFDDEGTLFGLMTLVTFLYFPTGEQICRITSLVTDKDKRGKGIGSTLIEAAKNYAKQHNCQQLEVTTSLSRYQAQQFYAKQGFEKRSLRYILEV